jgi:hypothetical protein
MKRNKDWIRMKKVWSRTWRAQSRRKREAELLKTWGSPVRTIHPPKPHLTMAQPSRRKLSWIKEDSCN